MTTTYQRDLVLPGIEPGHFKVPRNGVVPDVIARARAPRNQRPTPTMWPCEAAQCTMVETTSDARVGSRYFRTWSIPHLVAEPGYGIIQWRRLCWALDRINLPMLGQKLCNGNKSPKDKPCDLVNTLQVDYSRVHGAPALLLGASRIVRVVTPSMESLKRTFLGPGVRLFIPIRV